jgi:ABC-type lipoprotein release transport system permease subunit
MPCSSVITATTLVAIALLSVRERIRDYGVLKAIGLTPRQIASTLVGAHAAVALLAGLLSIPLGIGLYVTARVLDRRRRVRTKVVVAFFPRRAPLDLLMRSARL